MIPPHHLLVLVAALLSNAEIGRCFAPAATTGNWRRAIPGSEVFFKKAHDASSSWSAVAAAAAVDNSGGEQEDFDNYSLSMSPKQERRSVLAESQEYAIVDDDGKTTRLGRAWRWIRRNRVPPRLDKKPGALILLVTGESTWHANDTFTGWADPPLTTAGIVSSQHAARLLVAEGLLADIVYTSRLTRAIQTARAVLHEWDALYLPVRKTYRLNGRMYGAVQGLGKATVRRTFGAAVVQAWRNSLKGRPPPLPYDDRASPARDRRYHDLPVQDLPRSESQWDCQERARPVWEYRIQPDLMAGNNVLVVAHKDSLRGIIRQVDGLTEDTSILTSLSLPPGVPVVYRFDRTKNSKQVEPIPPESDDPRRMPNTNAVFLEKPGLLAKALEQQKNWRQRFDYSSLEDEEGSGRGRESTVERALWRLRLDQEELRAADKTLSHEPQQQLMAIAPKPAAAVASVHTRSAGGEHWVDDPLEFEDFEFFGGNADEENWVGDLEPVGLDDSETQKTVIPSLNIIPASETSRSNSPGNKPKEDDTVVVLVRHGRTPHNNMGLFTGWEDPPLAKDGEQDAIRAGRLLKRHGFEFDVVYTSQLTRAIQTASFILDELGCAWLPLVKSWRLNERMYGSLTGKSKRMIENEYGKEQLIKWRRGYKIRPPPVSSFSHNYPGNNVRRTKSVTDLPISWSESIARSLEQGRLVIHRRFPKTESLHDCMQRSIPFYTQRIVPEAVQKNKRVLIASHENAIRGILMHLCNIPEEAMRQLHLPNGLPLVYSVKGKCITLLEDDLDDDVPKVTIDDFGPASNYLFRPCELDDAFFEAMEKQENQETQPATV